MSLADWTLGVAPAVGRTGAGRAARRGAAGDRRARPPCQPRGWNGCSPSISTSARIGSTPGLRRSTRSASSLRAAQQKPRFHLGAFGWVENLRPSRRIASQSPPMHFRRRFVTRRARGSSRTRERRLLHAPSLAQAASAAVLRNGNISHAELRRSRERSRSTCRRRGCVRRRRSPMACAPASRWRRCSAISSSAGFTKDIPASSSIDSSRPLRDRFPLAVWPAEESAQGTSADVDRSTKRRRWPCAR